MSTRRTIIDGNEAAASVAYRASEIAAIYPITPASPMGELADRWSAAGRPNVWGTVPEVIEMQSEGGAAGALHGALQAGALATTFTASQGLLLMIPNMFKIAGELLPTVIHVASRTVATHALSIFGDHSDVMAARSTGFAMLCSSSVQEAQDFALIAHAATLRARVPFLHFFDGFRTSHEVNTIEPIDDEAIAAMLDEAAVRAHRERAMTPDHPVVRGTAQNPDVFFQAREACNRFYDDTPRIVGAAFDDLAVRTGRRYDAFDYVGAPDAERVVVVMGSAAGALCETIETLTAAGEKVGMVVVRLYRPFDVGAFAAALPGSVRAIAALDRTKEPGAIGEPLYADVVVALAENGISARVIGGRYGLSSKEFTPAMARAVFHELRADDPKRRFTVGITDDVTGLSLPIDGSFSTEDDDVSRAVLYGLGADGTVGAARSTVAIVGERTPLHAQGYFVYDSRKSGSMTASHLRFSPRPITSTYLVDRATFVACHQWSFLERLDLLDVAIEGATVLLNSPFPPEQVWDRLPAPVQQTVLDKGLRLYTVDAFRIARETGMPGRLGTIMQACLLALAGIVERDEALDALRADVRRRFWKRGQPVVERNLATIERALEELNEVPVGTAVTASNGRVPQVTADAPDFVQRVTAMMLSGKGDLLPVSALPVDGTFPVGTAAYERRSLAAEIPIWDPSICIDCAKCTLVCSHAAIRMKVFEAEDVAGAPAGFASKPFLSKDPPGKHMAIQVFPDACTGCGICVDVCPAHAKDEVRRTSIMMEPKDEHLERERANEAFFLSIPELDRTLVRPETVKGSQALEPLFLASGACEGCGETPYLKLLSQLYGDRILIANATGCSSIFGGNLPTTPWSANRDGRGPAWANSLFEDNAEFGFGMRLALDHRAARARALLERLGGSVGDDLVAEMLAADQSTEAGIAAQRARVTELVQRLTATDDPDARQLAEIADHLVRTGVWIVGGDGWAYDIGSSGLDHVLASGRDVNVLVLDTEVYSNTGGQASKATPRGAVAKFAVAGKGGPKKDLGLLAASYGNVYVAQIAMGADNPQTVKAFVEAEAWRGPSLIIAYSHCIAHGIEMTTAMTHQRDAVASGYWPLWRYDPRRADAGEPPFHLDSKEPSIPLERFTADEARFGMLARSDPGRAKELVALAQRDVEARWRLYTELAAVHHDVPEEAPSPSPVGAEDEEAGS